MQIVEYYEAIKLKTNLYLLYLKNICYNIMSVETQVIGKFLSLSLSHLPLSLSLCPSPSPFLLLHPPKCWNDTMCYYIKISLSLCFFPLGNSTTTPRGHSGNLLKDPQGKGANLSSQ